MWQREDAARLFSKAGVLGFLEIHTNRTNDGRGHFFPMRPGDQKAFFGRIRDVPEFEQHRRHVGRLQDSKPCRPPWTAQKARALSNLTNQIIPGELHRQFVRLGLRKIDQDVLYIITVVTNNKRGLGLAVIIGMRSCRLGQVTFAVDQVTLLTLCILIVDQH